MVLYKALADVMIHAFIRIKCKKSHDSSKIHNFDTTKGTNLLPYARRYQMLWYAFICIRGTESHDSATLQNVIATKKIFFQTPQIHNYEEKL